MWYHCCIIHNKRYDSFHMKMLSKDALGLGLPVVSFRKTFFTNGCLKWSNFIITNSHDLKKNENNVTLRKANKINRQAYRHTIYMDLIGYLESEWLFIIN